MVNVDALIMQSEIYDFLNELFLSTDIWGTIGPTIVVIAAIYLVKRDKFLGLMAVLMLSLFIANYLELTAEEAAYWWHSIILLLGVVVCMFQLASKR